MRHRYLIVMGMFGACWLTAALAQSATGGPNKPQSYISGPAPHPNPVAPVSSGNGGKFNPGTKQKK
jgi:hypothetical protein